MQHSTETYAAHWVASLKGNPTRIKRSLRFAVRDRLRIPQSIRRSARSISRTDQLESEAVCWAVYATSASIEDMRIDHGRTDVLMPKELLNRSNIVPVFQQVRREGVAERMATGRLDDPGFPNSFFDRPLQDGFVEMMPFLLTGLPILVEL